MLSLKSSDEIAYNGSNNCARMDLYADTASDLTGVTTFDSIVLLAGSSALDISTGDLYRMQSDGTWILQPGTGAFTNVYTKAEIDAMIANYYTKTESDDLFEWITVTITTDTLLLSFISDGTPLTSVTIKGNGQQNGTPTPDDPIQPEFVGTLSGADWTIPITCASQTTPLYLGEVSTTRRIKKWVLDGTENWSKGNYPPSGGYQFFTAKPSDIIVNPPSWIITHFRKGVILNGSSFSSYLSLFPEISILPENATANDFKNWLASQYANGSPVTLWYILATEQTVVVNEPLYKIGDYADTLTTDTPIPTAKGSNTLTVDTTLQPSEMTITGKIRET